MYSGPVCRFLRMCLIHYAVCFETNRYEGAMFDSLVFSAGIESLYKRLYKSIKIPFWEYLRRPEFVKQRAILEARIWLNDQLLPQHRFREGYALMHYHILNGGHSLRHDIIHQALSLFLMRSSYDTSADTRGYVCYPRRYA